MFQKFRRSEFNDMTFVTAQLSQEKKTAKKEEPKSLHDLMGSFRLDEWKEWKDETPLQTKSNYSSSLARSVKHGRKGAGNTMDASHSDSSSSPRASPGNKSLPMTYQFEFNINTPPAPHQSNAMDIAGPQQTAYVFTSPSTESPRSSVTQSPSESPRAPFFIPQRGLPSSQQAMMNSSGLYHSAAPATFVQVTPPRSPHQGLSRSDPSGRKRSSSRKSAFREITPGSFSKPTQFIQPEILSLGINPQSSSGTFPDSRVHVLSQSSRGRSHSSVAVSSKATHSALARLADSQERSQDNSEAMEVDPTS
jgi:hypothetical protein